MRYVILGNGIAGFTAAKTLREQHHDSEIILISEEPYLSYNRPMMTKAPLRGFDFTNFFIKQEEWYHEKNIKLILNTKIINLNSEAKTVLLDNGDSIIYDKCIYALGAKSFTPPINGVNQNFVFHFRTIEDVANLRKQLNAKTAIVIGGGVVGIESAWELKKMGTKVTLLEQATHLMKPLLDEPSAKILENLIIESGIQVKSGIEIEKITTDKEVILKNSDTIKGDIIVLCCGIRPNTELAKNAGININRSVVVNEKMETNVPDIYACGDCAEYQGFNYALWKQAILQAEVAAINASGKNLEYTGFERAVLFNATSFSLFAIGDLQGRFIVKEFSDISSPYFMVNKPKTINYSYQKYFLDENSVITGCVLIGDLHQMGYVKMAISEKWTIEKFENEVAR